MSSRSDEEMWESEESEGEMPPKSYTLITIDEVKERVNAQVSDFSDVFGLTRDESTALLIHYRWARLKLQDDWLENQLNVCLSAGLSCPQTQSNVGKIDNVQVNSKKAGMNPPKICDICSTLMTEQDSLQCGHTYCSQCWKDYLEAMIGSGILISKCPKFACALTVPESLFEKYLETRTFDKYIRLKCEHFVLFSKGVRWCPAPNCTFIAEFPTLGMCEIACKCGHKYCFACGEESHPPTPCHLMKKWRIQSLAKGKQVVTTVFSSEAPADTKTSEWIFKTPSHVHTAI